MKDAHAVLGVKSCASKEDIECAYKALVLRHHPDMNKDGDEKIFCSVQAAYAALVARAGEGSIPMRKTVAPGTVEHKVITLQNPDGTTVREQVWLRGSSDGRCNVLTSPYHDGPPGGTPVSRET